MTTTPPLESSEWTVRAHLSCSTASCTRCATTASARSTQRPVSDSLVWSVSSCIMCLLQLPPFVLYVFWWFYNVLSERPPGYDRVRNAEIGNKDFELDVLEEAYTTEHWLVRIYKVKWLTSLPSSIRSHISHRVVWNPKWFTGELEIFRNVWHSFEIRLV